MEELSDSIALIITVTAVYVSHIILNGLTFLATKGEPPEDVLFVPIH